MCRLVTVVQHRPRVARGCIATARWSQGWRGRLWVETSRDRAGYRVAGQALTARPLPWLHNQDLFTVLWCC